MFVKVVGLLCFVCCMVKVSVLMYFVNIMFHTIVWAKTYYGQFKAIMTSARCFATALRHV